MNKPFREGHQTALVKNVVSPVDVREKGLSPLAVHPFRFWVGVIYETLTVEAKYEVNGIAGQTLRRMDGLQMKSMYSSGDHPRLRKACRFVFAHPEECVLGQCSLASPTEYTF